MNSSSISRHGLFGPNSGKYGGRGPHSTIRVCAPTGPPRRIVEMARALLQVRMNPMPSQIESFRDDFIQHLTPKLILATDQPFTDFSPGCYSSCQTLQRRSTRGSGAGPRSCLPGKRFQAARKFGCFVPAKDSPALEERERTMARNSHGWPRHSCATRPIRVFGLSAVLLRMFR